MQDATGDHDAQFNPTGWGAPNIETTDVVKASVKMKNATTTAIYDVLPNLLDGTLITGPIELPNVLGDGIMEITYILETSNMVYDQCQKLFTMSRLDCCIDEKIVGILKYEDDKMYMDKIMMLSAYRDALYKSALSMNEDRVKYFMNKLKLICDPCATVK